MVIRMISVQAPINSIQYTVQHHINRVAGLLFGIETNPTTRLF